MSDQASVRGDSGLRRAVHATTQVLAFIAVLCIVIMLVAIVADVTRRSLAGKSVKGVVELGEVMMVVIVFLGLGYHGHPRGDHRGADPPRHNRREDAHPLDRPQGRDPRPNERAAGSAGLAVISRDGLPETPDWICPVRPETPAPPTIPPNIELGSE